MNTNLYFEAQQKLEQLRLERIADATTTYDADEIVSLFGSFMPETTCECPNKALHTTKSNSKEYFFSLGPETETRFRPIYGRCRHTSCSQANAANLKQLNREWGKYLTKNATIT